MTKKNKTMSGRNAAVHEEEVRYNRITRIKVVGLFERFNYDISLENGQDISIIIAPNGCGKTTIFNLVSFIFAPTLSGYKKIRNVPFDFCECYLSNGKFVKLISKVDEKSEKYKLWKRMNAYDREAGSVISHQTMLKESDGEVDRQLFLYINTVVDDKSIKVSEEFEKIEDGASYYGEKEDLFLRRILRNAYTVRESIRQQNCSVAITFIAADRLHDISLSSIDTSPYMPRLLRSGRTYSENYDKESANPIKDAQDIIGTLYGKIKDKYNLLQTEMKDLLPKAYLDKKNIPNWDYDEFRSHWDKYVNDIKRYCAIGLLDSADTIIDSDKLEDSFKKNSVFLCAYLSLFMKTLEPFEKEYDRLKLFLDILNKRNEVTRKKFKYGRQGVIVTVNEKVLSLEYLSSGEKNDFIMFFNLVFKSLKNGVVLIDEPEISLHIAWQEAFMDSLIEICKLNDVQAIVATHSPNIVNGHFELFAERGLDDGEKY